VRTPRPLLSALMALAATATASAQDAAPDRYAALEARIAELEARLAKYEEVAQRADALEQQVRIAQRKLEIKDEEALAAAAPSQPIVVAGEKGFALETRDKTFQLKLRGLVHADARDFLDDESLAPNADTYTLARVRPTLEGRSPVSSTSA